MAETPPVVSAHGSSWSWVSRAQNLIAGKTTDMYVSSPVIAEAVAALVGDRVGGTVLDPFCGTRSFLWPVLDWALQYEGPTEFVGFELNPMVAQAAEAIGRSERMMTTIEVADAYKGELPPAQVVVTCATKVSPSWPRSMTRSTDRIVVPGSAPLGRPMSAATRAG